MPELAAYEITALALQFSGLDTTTNLTVAERNQIGDAEKYIRLYLMRTDIQTRYTLAQQAEALGVSVATIKRWANSEEFQKIAAFMAPPSRSPMVVVGKEYLQTTLLPIALNQARELLEDPQTRRKTIAINNARRPLDKDNKQKKKILKEDLYNNLLNLMQKGNIKLLEDPEIYQSLKSVQYSIEDGRFKIFGNYTHIVEGLIRAAWCAKTKHLNIHIHWI